MLGEKQKSLDVLDAGFRCSHLRRISIPMLNTTQQLDTRIEIITPENIAFEYRVAGPFQRLPAYLIDLLCRLGILIALGFGLGLLQLLIGFSLGVGFLGMVTGLFLVLYFALDSLYGGLFEYFNHGQTPGKKMLGLRVVTADGQPINGMQAMLRNVLRVVDGLPTFALPFGDFSIPTFQLGLLAMAMNQRYQRLGDLAAGTMVVVEEAQRVYSVTRINEPEVLRLAAELPRDFRVSRSLARTLSDYVQRRQGFTWPKRVEVASFLAEPLRVRLNLPPGVHYDTLLCALYHLTFIEDHPEMVEGGTPFADSPPVTLEELTSVRR